MNIQIRMWEQANKLVQNIHGVIVYRSGKWKPISVSENRKFYFCLQTIEPQNINFNLNSFSVTIETKFNIWWVRYANPILISKLNQIKTELISSFNQNNARNSFLLAFFAPAQCPSRVPFRCHCAIRILWSSFWSVIAICAAVRVAGKWKIRRQRNKLTHRDGIFEKRKRGKNGTNGNDKRNNLNFKFSVASVTVSDIISGTECPDPAHFYGIYLLSQRKEDSTNANFGFVWISHQSWAKPEKIILILITWRASRKRRACVVHCVTIALKIACERNRKDKTELIQFHLHRAFEFGFLFWIYSLSVWNQNAFALFCI